MRRWFLGIGFLGLFCGLVYILGSVIYVALTQGAFDTSSAFMFALRDENFDAAFNLMSPDLQDQVQTAAALRTAILNADAVPAAWAFDWRWSDNTTAALGGRVTMRDGQTFPLYITLRNFRGVWLIVTFSLTGQ
jgi:hypothetical protein